jgi:hypothetical protein
MVEITKSVNWIYSKILFRIGSKKLIIDKNLEYIYSLFLPDILIWCFVSQ